MENAGNFGVGAMTRDDIIRALRAHEHEMHQRFRVQSLSLFGSAARDQLRDDSDVDLLVEFHGPHTFDAYFGLKSFIEDMLGRSVDLVTQPMLKPRLKQNVSADLVHVT